MLTRISQVVGEVGVLSVAPPPIPLDSSVTGFDTRHGVSSEGFLATLTRRLCENVSGRIFLSYSFSRGVIQIRPPSGSPSTEESKSPPKGVQAPKADFPRRESKRRHPKESIRIDLMILDTSNTSRRILEASNPTDESFGRDEILNRRPKDERVLHSTPILKHRRLL